jgi:uncharacterized protein YjiS (DUF1127 family)
MSATTHGMVTQCQVGPSRHVGVLGRLGTLFATWRRRSQERQTLAHLEYRDLRDMGVSQWEVETELAKPFWRD